MAEVGKTEDDDSADTTFLPPLTLEDACPLAEEVVDELSKTWGDERLRKLQVALSRADSCAYLRVNLAVTSVEAAQRELREHLGETWEVHAHGILPDLLCVPCLPVRSLAAFDASLPEVVVDARCGVAVLRGAAVFVPGIKAVADGVQAGMLVNVCADVGRPALRRGARSTVARQQRRIYLGCGEALLGRKEALSSDRGVAVRMRSLVVPTAPELQALVALPSFVAQQLPSVVAGHLLAPQAGEVVLDMCAAPGGKTSHLASLMRSRGVLVAVDKSRSRMKKLRRTLKTLQLASFVRTLCTDGRKLVRKSAAAAEEEEAAREMSAEERGARVCDALAGGAAVRTGFAPGSFDAILLDAPCSALGQRPALVADIASRQQLHQLLPLQRALASTAAALLKPGGRLVYSTCTLNVCENEGIVHHMVADLGLQLQPIAAELRLEGGSVGTPTADGLTAEQCDCVQLFSPERSDTLGFFMALLTKPA